MTSNFFNVIRSLTDELELLEVLFPDKLTADFMELMACCQLGFIS